MDNNFDELKKTLEEFKTQNEKTVQELVSKQSSAYNDTIAELKSGIEKAQKAIEQVKEESEKRKNLGLPGVNDEKEKFSFAKLFGAMVRTRDGEPNAWSDAGFEREVLTEYAKKRDASSIDGTSGGYLVPEEVKGDLIDLTLAQMPIVNMGITKFTGLYGDLPIPKLTQRPTAYMVGETAAPGKTDVSFGEITLRPHKVAAFTKMSRRLAYQTRGAAETIIRNSLSEAMALKMHDQLINGIGAANEVLGLRNRVANMTSTTAIGSNGGRFKIDKASEMIENLDEANEYRDTGMYGWLMRPVVLGGMKRERVIEYTSAPSSGGMPVLGDNLLMSNKVLEDKLGHMLRTTTQISAAETKGTSSSCAYSYFGNWKMFYLGLWRDFELRISDVASDASGNSAFLNDQIYLVAFQEFDCSIGRDTAFTYVPDCETTKSLWTD